MVDGHGTLTWLDAIFAAPEPQPENTMSGTHANASASPSASQSTSPLPSPFVWYELMTTDLPAATRFYSQVLGWQTEVADMGFPYTLVSAAGKQLAGMMTLPADAAAAGAPPAWSGYVGVAHCDAAVSSAKAAGATVVAGPQDIPGVGRFATLIDPQGAAFVAFQDFGSTPLQASPPSTPGTVGWHELLTTDSEDALGWYGRQFGWKADEALDMGEMGMYRMFTTGGTAAGGIMNRPPEMPVSAWMFYFNADAIDAAVTRVESAGGKVCMGPMEVPGGSWVVNCSDPQGVMFALVAPKR